MTYAYQRQDGRYDLFNVEPTIVTASQYAAIKKREELQAHKAQLLVQRNSIDAAITDVDKQIAATNVPLAEPAKAVAGSATDVNGRRKW